MTHFPKSLSLNGYNLKKASKKLTTSTFLALLVPHEATMRMVTWVWYTVTLVFVSTDGCITVEAFEKFWHCHHR